MKGNKVLNTTKKQYAKGPKGKLREAKTRRNERLTKEKRGFKVITRYCKIGPVEY